MKVRITANDFILPKGTVLNIGPTEERIWSGKYEEVEEKADPLDHDRDGKKGGFAKS